MTETAQELRDQAAELLRRSVALDRAASEPDSMAAFAKKLFAADPDDDHTFAQPNKGDNK